MIVVVGTILAAIVAQGPMRTGYERDAAVRQQPVRQMKTQPTQAQRNSLRRIQQMGGTAFDGHLRTPVVLADREGRILAEFIIETDNRPKEAAFTVVLNGRRDIDEILRHAIALGNVEQLSLAESGITDDLLQKVGTLHNLRLLYLTDTRIGNVGVSHLGKLRALEMLGLRGTGVSDQGLTYLEQMESLKGLSLEGLPITDEGLAHIAGLDALVALCLKGTQVTDDGLEHLFVLPNLLGLDLQDTQVTAPGIERLTEALPNCKIGR